MDKDEKAQILAIWSKAVDTQMHFNEMSVKSRQLGLTFVAAALGISVVLISRGEDYAFPAQNLFGIEFELHVSVVLIAVALLGLFAVRTLDLGVYHVMLRGAVTFGEDLEENYLKGNFFDLEKGMTQAISHYSRHSDAAVNTERQGSKYKYSGNNKKSAGKKISNFYNISMSFLAASALVMFLISSGIFGGETNENIDQSPVPEVSTGEANT